MRVATRTGARRGGYTLIELLVVNLLLTLLVVLIAGAWRAFGPLCVEVIRRGRIVNEANIAAQAIYQDANLKPQGQPLAKVESPDGSSIRFDYGTKLADGSYPFWVLYTLQPAADPPGSTEFVLKRGDASGASMTIARHLGSASASAINLAGGKSQVDFSLTFVYKVSPIAAEVSQSQYTFAVHN